MSVSISVQWDRRGIAGLETGELKNAVVRALRKAGQTALRDMRGECELWVADIGSASSRPD